MSEGPPMTPEAPRRSSPKLSRTVLMLWAASASLAVLVLGLCCALLLLRARQQEVKDEPLLAKQGVPFQETISANDFAASNSVTIGLGERELDGGVRHISTEADGLTAIGTVNGSPCRQFNLPERPGRPWQIGFFYFALDPTFKKKSEDVKSVRIEVEYCSASRGRFTLQYDAMGSPKTLQSSFTRAKPDVRLDGTKEWKMATFHIGDGAFENSENGHSDFRIEVVPPDINIRRVTVTRE